MIPYWDWTDPAPIMTDTFLGPNGDSTGIIRQRLLRRHAPGAGTNHHAAPAVVAGRARRLAPAADVHDQRRPVRSARCAAGSSLPATLPSAIDLRDTLDRTTYSAFQRTLETGNGLASGNQMHNGHARLDRGRAAPAPAT